MQVTKRGEACPSCKGSGHTKDSRPAVEFKTVKGTNNKVRTVHHTIKQGSGCGNCGGLGVKRP